MLSARIDRLPETTKHVLQHAAVIGLSFDLRVLRRLTGLNGGFDSHIRSLQDASLIEPSLENYAFRHVLIQEAAYESILLKNRTQIHRQIGEILEELHADRLEEFAPLLAFHFYSAGDARSLKYDTLAGGKAARLYANAEAATHFRRALEVASHSDSDASDVDTLADPGGLIKDINGHGDVVAHAGGPVVMEADPSSGGRPYRTVRLGLPDSTYGGGNTIATELNDARLVVGHSYCRHRWAPLSPAVAPGSRR